MVKYRFEVLTPFGVQIRTTEEYWEYLVQVKHPVMENKVEIVRTTLADPDEIRRSKIDNSVFLYYKKVERMYCAVARHQGQLGYLITAYPVDKVKEGEIVWTR